MEDIESNDASDWLEKASTRLVSHSLASQGKARKLQSIDELFQATKRGFKRLYEGGEEAIKRLNTTEYKSRFFWTRVDLKNSQVNSYFKDYRKVKKVMVPSIPLIILLALSPASQSFLFCLNSVSALGK